MQNLGYLIVDGNIILVLARTKKHYRMLRIRHSGEKGVRFVDEELYLKDNEHLVDDLITGKVIIL